MQQFLEHLLEQQIREGGKSSGDPEVDELAELALELKGLWQPDPKLAKRLDRELRMATFLPKSPRRTKPLEVREDG